MNVLVGNIQVAFQGDTWSIYHSRSRRSAVLVATSLAPKAATTSSAGKQCHHPATRSMKTAVEDPELERLSVVDPGKAAYSLTEKIQVLPLAEVRDTWNYG